MGACNPLPRVHRDCFDRWPKREAYTRALFERYAWPENPPFDLAVFHRTDSIVAAVSARSVTLADAIVLVRHDRALDQVIIPLSAWKDWLGRRESAWPGSAHADDLVLFASELPALRAAYPNADAISASAPVRMLRDRIAAQRARERARARNEALALRRDNAHARALAEQLRERPLPCPHCAVMLLGARFIEGNERRRSYFICQGCGRSFGPRELDRR